MYLQDALNAAQHGAQHGDGISYTVGKISIWPPADFASLATCKEMCAL